MSLKDNEITEEIANWEYPDDNKLFRYTDVKEAVLKFENSCLEIMGNTLTDNDKHLISKNLLIIHREIFGDFEK